MSVFTANSTILQGKLCMPDAGSLLSRPALLKQLDDQVPVSLSVITAPAGYGKTSLVCDWLAHNNLPYCWFSIDQKDNQPSSFWTYLCACLKRVDSAITNKAELFLENTFIEDYCLISDALIESLEKIARKWDRPNKIIIVLDDFHHINHPQILEPFKRFLDYLPAWVKVVMTSRSLPPLNVPARTSKLQAHVMYSRELAFNLDQIAEFLATKLDLDVGEEQLKNLYDKTEGWAAAIQLAGIAIKSGVSLAHLGSDNKSTQVQGRDNPVLMQDSLLADFLFEEVFSQLSGDLQKSLLAISVVDSFNAALSDAINQQSNSEALIKALTESGLFIVKLANGHHWYRLHILFRDWLFDHGQKKSPQQVLDWQQRALTWLNKNAFHDEALNLAFALQDWYVVADIMRQLYPTMIQMGQLDHALTIINQMPVNVVSAMPHLNMLRAVMCFNQYQYDESHCYLDKIEFSIKHFYQNQSNQTDAQRLTTLADMGLANVEDLELLATGIKILQSQMARFNGDPQRAKSLDAEVINSSRLSDNHLLCWTHYGAMVDGFILDNINDCLLHGNKALTLAKQVEDGFCVIASLGWVLQGLYHNGQPHQAVALGEETLSWLEENSLLNLPNISTVHGAMVMLYTELNQLGLAWREYGLLINSIQTFTEPREVIFSKYHCHAQLLNMSGLLDEARNCLQDLAQYEHVTFDQNELLQDAQFSVLLDTPTMSALLELQSDNLFPLMQLAQEPPTLQSHNCNFRYQFERFIYVAGKMLMGSDEQELLTELEQHSKQQGVLTRQISCHLLPANILFNRGDQQVAMVHFKQAITLAAPCGYINLIINTGAQIRPMLEQALAEGIEAAYCQQLLEQLSLRKDWPYVYEDTAASVPESLAPSIAQTYDVIDSTIAINSGDISLIESLSPREMEVLTHLSQGARNKDIAQQMHLSLSTVKRHLQNIYGKLQVGSRTEALMLFNQLQKVTN